MTSESDGKRHILQIFNSMEGGANIPKSMSQSIRSDKIACDALVLRASNLAGVEAFDSYEASQLPKDAWKGIRLKIFAQLYKTLRARKPDVVVTHRYKEFIYALILVRWLKIPKMVSFFHGERDFESKMRRTLTRILLDSRCTLVAVSPSVKNYITDSIGSAHTNTIKVVNNSVDFEKIKTGALSKKESRKFLALPQDAIVFGSVGRLVKTKGTETLVRAFIEVAAAIPNSLLLLMGEGEDREKLELLIKEHNLESRVFMPGKIPEAFRYMQAIDYFVFPSIREGFGLALVEAMAARIPVIASEIDVFKNMMVDKKYLVPVLNTKALSKAMVSISQESNDCLTTMVNAQYDFCYQHYSSVDAEKNYRELLLGVLG